LGTKTPPCKGFGAGGKGNGGNCKWRAKFAKRNEKFLGYHDQAEQHTRGDISAAVLDGSYNPKSG